MGFLRGRKTDKTLRRATEGLLQEPTDAILVRARFLHGAQWFLREFADSAARLAVDSDRARIKTITASLGNRDRASALVRVGAWALAARSLLAARDVRSFDVFRKDFGVASPAEARLADFRAEGHDGDDARLARTSLEFLVMASRGELPADGYKDNVGLVVFVAQAITSCLTNSEEFVDSVVKDLGRETAEAVLRHCPD